MIEAPCLCGGLIVAVKGGQFGAVTWHNMSLMHRIWRLRREGPTALNGACDVSKPPPRASVRPVKRG